MLATHLDAERRYEALRKIALDAAQRGAAEGIRFSAISSDALSAAKAWMTTPSRRVDWDWVRGYSEYRFRYPKRFEVALWEQSTLVALSLGRPTYNGNHLRLDFVEARPKSLGDRISVLDEILLVYTIYARLLSAAQIRIMHPINDDVKSYYRAHGYVYVSSGDYLNKDL